MELVTSISVVGWVLIIGVGVGMWAVVQWLRGRARHLPSDARRMLPGEDPPDHHWPGP